tara:strand:+ start:1079 stop:1243 length:165 start_codon:yes stop_codon:yes gene_type:complete
MTHEVRQSVSHIEIKENSRVTSTEELLKVSLIPKLQKLKFLASGAGFFKVGLKL